MTHAELTGIVQAAVAAVVPAAAVTVPRTTLAEREQEQVNLALKKAVKNSSHFKAMAETMTFQANQIEEMHATISRQGAHLGTLKVAVQGLVKTESDARMMVALMHSFSSTSDGRAEIMAMIDRCWQLPAESRRAVRASLTVEEKDKEGRERPAEAADAEADKVGASQGKEKRKVDEQGEAKKSKKNKKKDKEKGDE